MSTNQDKTYLNQNIELDDESGYTWCDDKEEVIAYYKSLLKESNTFNNEFKFRKFSSGQF